MQTGLSSKHKIARRVFSIVPTHVGVNRTIVSTGRGGTNRPHTRGGEPVATWESLGRGFIVPTHVGVNPFPSSAQETTMLSSPHTWG
jgi:hypothetical protein